ncbi:MAG: carbamoyltransferase [Opitutaceae bacterium]
MKPVQILGISAFYHDAAAAFVRDGVILAAAQEERFTRIKHDAGFPAGAVDYCLKATGVAAGDLDFVAFYDKPLLKFDRLLETYLATAPLGLKSFLAAMPLWIKEKLHLPRVIRAALGHDYKRRIVFTAHHESHAASAFFPSPFEEAAILTLDGVGEWATASFGTGQGNKIELRSELHFPHSLGLLYSAFTYYCGFKVNSGEYKLMGLAPYGTPAFRHLILERLIDLKDDGSFRMDMSYFNYCAGLTMTSKKFHALFGGPPRKPEDPVTQRTMDLAASIQQVCEEIMLRIGCFVHAQTGQKRLCLAGGVALNCVGNGRLLREGPFEDIWIQPAAGDAGGALGAALFVSHQLLDQPRQVHLHDSMSGSLLGPAYSDEQVAAFLVAQGVQYSRWTEDDELCDYVAKLLSEGKVIGWLNGRMEFGPRALGARSILGDARNPDMQSKMNLKIKFRESFRPFAPAVLESRVCDYFDFKARQQSPYMLLVAPVLASRRMPQDQGAEGMRGIEKLRLCRSQIPAVTHVDYSARVQTVDKQRHGRFHTLLRKFEQRTGCPVIINTSFNIRGEPIVCTPEEALRCFMATNMDVLVLERFVLLKDEQPIPAPGASEKYLARFKRD